MKVVDGKMVRNKRNTFEAAQTKGVRATPQLWCRVKTQAEARLKELRGEK